MGITNTELFTDRQNEIAMIAKAFSHPARIAIIDYLLQSKSCINGHLVDELGLAQATISQHLKELKNIGIIKGTIDGVKVSYCIHPERWEEIRTYFLRFFDQFMEKNNCC